MGRKKHPLPPRKARVMGRKKHPLPPRKARVMGRKSVPSPPTKPPVMQRKKHPLSTHEATSDAKKASPLHPGTGGRGRTHWKALVYRANLYARGSAAFHLLIAIFSPSRSIADRSNARRIFALPGCTLQVAPRTHLDQNNALSCSTSSGCVPDAFGVPEDRRFLGVSNCMNDRICGSSAALQSGPWLSLLSRCGNRDLFV